MAQERPEARQDARGAWLAHRPGVRPQPGEKRHQTDQGEDGERGLEAQEGERKAAQRRSQDLPGVGHCVEAAELYAARPGKLARHCPGGGPEGGAGEDQGELPQEQHPESLGEHEPDAGRDRGPAGAQHDAPAADAVRIGAADEVERRLGEDRGGEQGPDLGVRKPLGIGVQGHRQPGHAEAEIPSERGDEEHPPDYA
jgi:hypothetical protein